MVVPADPLLESLTEGDLYDRVWVRAPEVEWFARRLDPEGGVVFEAGCGTGRVTLPLLRAGFRVLGQDLSAERLELCRRKAASLPAEVQGRLTLRHGDVVAAFPDGEFSAVLLPFNMAAEFDGTRLAALLRKARASLGSGGPLIAVQVLPSPLELQLGQSRFTCEGRAFPDGTRLLFESTSLLLPDREGRGEHETRYWLSYKAIRGNVVAREWIYSGVLWYRPPDVFRAMLEDAGFRVVEHWGDSLGRKPFEPGFPVSALVAVPESGRSHLDS